MRSAPPVQMTCGRDAWWTAFHTLLHALAAATLAGWVAARLVPGLLVLCAGLAALAAAAWAWRRARQESVRRLSWNGRHWMLDDQPVQLSLMMMAGESWALARARTAERRAAVWLPVRLFNCGAPPHLARAALHAHG